LDGITRRFGQTLALDQVSLAVERGAIHAIVGENGAGKTTLMQVLFGAIKPDAGELFLGGKPFTPSSSREAIDAGIGMVSQHYGIIPQLSILENLMLGFEGGPLLNRIATRSRAQDIAARLGFVFDWNAEAETLSPAANQRLEILRLLWRGARLLILDEPTAMLSPADATAIFSTLRSLVDEGATVLLVTHRIAEVMAYCSHVSILRRGQLAGDLPVNGTTEAELTKLIIGTTFTGSASVSGSAGEQVLHFDHPALGRLQMRQGEIVGLAGVDGSGQSELLQRLIGVIRERGSDLTFCGRQIGDATVSERIGSGFRIIPEDRLCEALIPDWSVEANAVLGLQRLPTHSKGLLIDKAGRRKAAARIARRFATQLSAMSQPVSDLSGGNQQRLVAGRAMEGDPKVIVAFQPARGLDVASTEAVYQGIRSECARGATALVASFDLDELLIHCDRVVAIQAGRLRHPPAGLERDRDAIGSLMVGA
jgi:simple sugar transport system ATP-binding protein